MINARGAPLKVLMTADTVGGVWTYAIDLARALGDEGIQVALATMGGMASREQRREAASIARLEFYESEYRLPWMAQPWADVKAAAKWLLDIAAQVAPDLVHLNEPVHASAEWNVPVISVAHSCVLSWWQAVWNTSAPAAWNRYQQEMREGLSNADAVVAPSAWMLQQLRRYYGIRDGRVIANGRQPSSFEAGIKAPVIFAAGRVWDPAKNLMALEPVADGLPWPIYVAGETQHPDGDESLQADHVHFLGRLASDETAAWLR